MLLWLKSKKYKGSECLTFWFDGELPEFLLIYLYHNFSMNGCKIGPEDSLKMVLSMED